MKKIFMSLLFVFAVLFSSYFGNSIAAEELPKRVDGKDRFEVAVELSQEWKQSSTIVIANYKAFADALSAGPLAYKENAPILLSKKDSLTDITTGEIKRLNPQKVIIVGGTGSISEKVEKQVKAAGVRRVERISGNDRFEVAENIALKLDSWDKAVVAFGLNFPDALAIAPYAAYKQYPILLTATNKLPKTTGDLIKSKGIKETLIVGGEGSVSKKVESQLPAPERIGGKDRYEVAANIAGRFFPTAQKAYLATGSTFADALAGSVLAARQKAPVLLTSPNFVPLPTLSFFKNNIIEEYVILGGVGSVSDTLVSDVQFHKNSNQPVIYFVPHADDEVLTYGIDIVNQLNRNREVKLVLLTEGDDSTVREMLNGHFDQESVYGVLNLRVRCSWHGVYHDPVMEKFLHGHISMDEFGDIRVDEYHRASERLGVNKENILSDLIPLQSLTIEEVKVVMRKYIKQYPLADFRTMSVHDLHQQHVVIGKALHELEEAGEIDKLQTNYFLSVYTDQISKRPVDLPVRTLRVDADELNDKIDLAAYEYQKYNPEHGMYASGYHSVARQFELIKRNQYIRFHH